MNTTEKLAYKISMKLNFEKFATRYTHINEWKLFSFKQSTSRWCFVPFLRFTCKQKIILLKTMTRRGKTKERNINIWEVRQQFASGNDVCLRGGSCCYGAGREWQGTSTEEEIWYESFIFIGSINLILVLMKHYRESWMCVVMRCSIIIFKDLWCLKTQMNESNLCCSVV
jgi:hypothetical protein